MIIATMLFVGIFSQNVSGLDVDNCNDKQQIWELLGKNEFTKMFASDPETLDCIPYYEGEKLPKEIEGKYVNSDVGMEITLPVNWFGIEIFAEDNSKVYLASKDDDRWRSDDSSTFNMHFIILDKSTARDLVKSITDDVMDGNDYVGNTIGLNFCKKESQTIVSVNGMDSKKITLKCPESFYTSTDTITFITHVFETDEKFISVSSVWLHKDTTQINTLEFDEMIKTIQIENPLTLEKTETSSDSKTSIPDWIRNNAEWWAQGAIGDSDFVGGIQYLIKEDIIQIPETTSTTTASESNEIPSWIKNNADWWSQGLISDDDFVKGIQFLVEQGIIVV